MLSALDGGWSPLTRCLSIPLARTESLKSKTSLDAAIDEGILKPARRK